MHILFVEDEQSVRELIESVVHTMPFVQAEFVGSGIEAVEICSQKTFDVLWLKMDLPILDGIDTLRTIYQYMPVQSRPISIITLESSAIGLYEKLRQIGVWEIIELPLTPEKVHITLQEIPIKQYHTETHPPKPMTNLLDMDTIEMLKEVGGDDNPEFLKELYDLFILRAPSLIDEIATCVADKNTKELSQAAHALKGSALNIGLIAIGDCAKVLEDNARANNVEGLHEYVEKLRELYPISLQAFSAVM